ncbi:MAG: glycine cleavage system protein GcvH [Planctomycetota bacterium]|jgi:glycine cleavage system H protein|nr:glycine cleavage system protein GcvH [Planctomycetota bacterium]
MSLHYMESHEWAKLDGDEVVIGLSAFAAGEVGEVIHVELPAVGDAAKRGQPLAEIESVKSVNDFYAPIDGEVVAINEALADAPELVNESAEDKGWFCRIKPSAAAPFDGLLNAAAYQTKVEQG